MKRVEGKKKYSQAVKRKTEGPTERGEMNKAQ